MRASAHNDRVEQAAVEEGMTEFHRAALLKVAGGETSLSEVLRVTPAEVLRLEG